MGIKKKFIQLIFCVFAFTTFTVKASPIYWSLQNVFFSDGSALQGGFIIDPLSGYIIDIDITTTAGALPGFHYTPTNSAIFGFNVWGVNPNSFVVGNTSPFAMPYLNLSFFNALDTVNSNYLKISPFLDGNWECTNGCGLMRYIISGSAESVAITINPVPEPPFMALLGLPALLLLRNRKHNAAHK